MSTGALKLEGRSGRARAKGWFFYVFLLASLAVGFIALSTLLIDVFKDGIGQIDRTLITGAPNVIEPATAGAGPAILATIYLMFLLLFMAVPIGVATSIYLEEYADKTRWYNRVLDLNIQNLAAVPSIVYGILGLAFIVRGPVGIGRVLLAGAMILTLLVLPTVIIASREAIRAIPDSIRQGGLALGATQWQVIWRQVLPAAVPGIATGTILALSRAIGETAPLLLVGALSYISFNPTLLGDFTALPIQIYQWIQQDEAGFTLRAAGGIIVLLAILLTMNAFAIFIRNRYQKRW